MKRSTLALLLLAVLPLPASPQPITRTVGQLTLSADPAQAFPGGLLVVRLRRSLGATFAILNGRRVPFLDSPRGPRALMPIPVGTPPGHATLGIELWARRGRQRIAVEVPITPRTYPGRSVVVPEAKRALLASHTALADGRRLLVALRTATAEAQWSGPFRAPLAVAPAASFGVAETYVGGSTVDSTTDAIYGEYHRGADYEVPAGTGVLAPAAGTVLLAGPLALSGQTLVLDHGQGLVSAFFHLGRIDVREGDRVAAQSPIGLSGETGIATSPHLHWGVYVHGVAVDPAVLLKLPE